MKFTCILFCLISIATSQAAIAQTLVVPPSPGSGLANASHLFQSNDYTVEVKKSGDANYTTCFVYETDNWASNMWGGERRPQTSASFVNFSFDGTPVDVRITTSFTANSVAVRPLAFGVVPVRAGNVITFTLLTPKKISVEVNNRLNPLFIFADKPDVVPAPASVTYYYGPGYHDIGFQKQLNSNESVYIAGGAVLEGTFYLPTGTHDVTVRGRGIISGGKLPTAVERTNSIDAIQKYAVFTGRKNDYGTTIHYNLNFEGFTMVSTCGTHFAMVNGNHQNHHNTFRNLKEVDWSVNTDNVFDGDDNIVDDCFFFNNDDLTVTRSSFRLKISNCVFWNFIGRLFWTANYGTSSDCTWENIEVIGDDKGPDFTDISSGTSGMMKNFIFKNINIESRVSAFINISTGTTKIENWLFENFTFSDLKADEGVFDGNSTGTMDITFRNLKMGGNYITSLAQGHMTADAYCNIDFEVQPLDLPVPQGVVQARLSDGTGTGTAQQYPGSSGDGWTGKWVASSAVTPTVVATTPLKTGMANYLKVARTGGTSASEGVYRQFSNNTRPYNQFTRQTFDVRLDSTATVFNTTSDSLSICDRSTAAVGVAGDSTWHIRASGAAVGGMQAREWCVFNGNPGVADPDSASAYIPTELICQPGVTYSITVDVYAAAAAGNTGGRNHGTYDVTITDGTTTKKIFGAGFRSSAYALGGYLSCSTQQSATTDNLTFSLDNVEMTSLTPTALPGSTTISLASSGNPAVVGTPLTFTATVTAGAGTATGSVTFYRGSTALGTAALNASGVATLTTSLLPIGTHPLHVAYGGGSGYSSSVSGILSQVINATNPTPVVLYRETFGNAGAASIRYNAATIGWQQYTATSSGANVANTSASGAYGGVEITAGSPANLDNVNAGTSASLTNGFGLNQSGVRTLAFTTEFPIDRTQHNVTTLSWYAQASITGGTHSAALRIAGNWYVTVPASITATGNSANFNSSAVLVTVDLATAEWRTLTSAIGAPFAVGATAVPLPTGNIEAFGAYFTLGSLSTTRFDTFTVTAAPAAAPENWETWLTRNFTFDELFNPALEATDWGALADPDGNDLVNLLEYALGGEPATGIAAEPPVGVVGQNGLLSLTFTRLRNDLDYYVESCGNLGTWSVISQNPGVIGQPVTVPDQPSLNPSARFMRLRVVEP